MKYYNHIIFLFVICKTRKAFKSDKEMAALNKETMQFSSDNPHSTVNKVDLNSLSVEYHKNNVTGYILAGPDCRQPDINDTVKKEDYSNCTFEKQQHKQDNSSSQNQNTVHDSTSEMTIKKKVGSPYDEALSADYKMKQDDIHCVEGAAEITVNGKLDGPYDKALPGDFNMKQDDLASVNCELHNGHPYFLYDKDYNDGKRIPAEQTSSDTQCTDNIIVTQNPDYAYSYMKTKGSDIPDTKPLNHKHPYSYASFNEVKPKDKPLTYSYADNRGKVIPGITKHIVGEGYSQQKPTTVNKTESVSHPNQTDPYSYAGTDGNNEPTVAPAGSDKVDDVQSNNRQESGRQDMDGYQQIDSPSSPGKVLPGMLCKKTDGTEYQEIDAPPSDKPSSDKKSVSEYQEVALPPDSKVKLNSQIHANNNTPISFGAGKQEVKKPTVRPKPLAKTQSVQDQNSRESAGAYQEITFPDNDPKPALKSTFTKDGIELLPNEVYGQVD